MADIITNPVIPYGGNIPGGLFPSKTIYIQGYVPPQSDKFFINLQCGLQSQPRPDIAIHINPRFRFQQQHARYVVLNSCVAQRWGGEERPNSFPFVQGQNFEVIILCEINEFKIAVNGSHFASFKHRVTDLYRITSLQIGEAVKIYNIRYDPPSVVAQQPMPVYPPATHATVRQYNEMQLLNPPCPYVGLITGGLQFGTVITVKVTVLANPTRFNIDLQTSMAEYPGADIAFHFNPRFKEKTIVRNSMKGTRWDPNEEKTASFFPFVPNGTYEISILCMKTCFIVLVDGSKMAEYKHRQVVHTVNAMAVAGNVYIREITVN